MANRRFASAYRYLDLCAIITQLRLDNLFAYPGVPNHGRSLRPLLLVDRKGINLFKNLVSSVDLPQ